MKKIYTILILFVAFISASFAQEIKRTDEEKSISGGAEYSQLLEQQKKLGNANLFEFNGTIPFMSKTQAATDVTATIEGINFDEDAALNGSYHIPPDPHGAAGPSHLVAVVNTSIEWYTKAGATQNSQSLASFFSSLSPLTGTFDPKVIYDQYFFGTETSGRFVVVTLEQTTSPNTSRILVAVSKTSDPNGGWWFTSINSAVTISSLCWADYPGLAVTDDAILITNNMFSFSGNSFQGSRLWIIQKSSFYSGGAASFGIYDPSTAVGISQNFTMQPAHMFGTLPTGVKSYLVASGWGVPTDFFSVITIGGTSASPSFSNTFVSHLSDIHNTGVAFPEAPQPGTSTLINTPGNRVMNAVWRNNNLWAVNTINPPSGVNAGQATAHWYRMGTSGTISLADQGNIGGEDIAAGTHIYYPSIAVNSSNDAIIGFAASSAALTPTIYPGAYYAGRFSSTPAGTVLASQIFKPGLDYYIRIFAFNGGTRNRWGDYSGSSVDPSDDQTFYLFNEYALTRGTLFPIGVDPAQEDGRWGTAFGVVPITSLPVELAAFSASIIGSSVKLNWETATEVNNYGFDVLRQAHTSTLLSVIGWEKIGFVNGNGNSNSPKSYGFIDKNVTSGNYTYRLKQIDNDGQFEYSKAIEVDLGAPKKFELSQNYPNPFNPSTTIRYSLPEAGNVKLTLFNILGQELKTLVNEFKESGVHTINFNASELNSGLYIYKIEANGFTQTRKMTLIK